MSGSLTQWFSHEPIRNINPRQTALDGDEARPRVQALATHCLEVIYAEGFADNTDAQCYVIGFFMAFHRGFADITKAVEIAFLQVSGMIPERFEQVVKMHWHPEAATKVRSAVKATRGEAREPLPGEEIYPRDNWIGQYLQYVENTASPLAYHFWCAVATLGAACRRNIYWQWNYILYPNLYMFIIGPSACGKSTALGLTQPLIKQANFRWRKYMEERYFEKPGPVWVGDPKGSDSDLEKVGSFWAWPNRQITILDSKPTPQEIVKHLSNADDGSVPGVPLVGVDSVAWLLNGEASTWLARKDTFADGSIKLFTDIYNCSDDGFSQATIARGSESIEYPCFSILLGSTMGWINKSISTDMLQEGFVRRFLFVYRPAGTPIPNFDENPPPPLDPLLASVLANQMATLMAIKEPREVVPTAKAKKLYTDMMRKNKVEIADPENPKMLPYYLGKPNLIMKTALTLAVNSNMSPGVKVDDFLAAGHLVMHSRELELAIMLVESEEVFNPECFARMGEHSHAIQSRAVEETIVAFNIRYQRPMLHSSELYKALKGQNMSAKDWQERLEMMVKSGEMLRGSKVAKGARGAPPKWYWDPKVLDWDDDRQCVKGGEGE